MVRWQISGLFLAAAAAIGSSHVVAADEPAKAAQKAPPAETSDEEAVDPFKIPEGKDPKEIQAFLQGLANLQPAKRTAAGFKDHFHKLNDVVKEVLAKELDEQTALIASDMRMQVLSFLAGRLGEQEADADRKALIEQMQKDARPTIADRGMLYSLMDRLASAEQADAAARKALIEEVGGYLRAGEVSQEKLQLALQTSMMMEQLSDLENAAAANEVFAKSLESLNDERLAETVEQFRATGRRLSLPGKEMELKGKTLTGEDFNISQLKGKVVLVDFWATWCGPCIASLPHIKELYAAYKDKGFEVVGISLDNAKADLEAYVKEEKLPWVQLFPENEEQLGWNNPIARYYGVSGIPTAILLDKDGKVLSLAAHGRELDALLEKQLGPIEKKPETEAATEEPAK